jgi:AraC-like DNA-binding protein
MIFKYYYPSPPLNHYIKEYLLVHFKFDKQIAVPPKIYPVFPEQGFTFYIRGFCLADTPDIALLEKRPRSVIFGQPTYRQDLHVSLESEYLMLNVSFYPGTLFKLFRTPMAEFSHKNIDAEAVLGQEMKEVNEKLANHQSYDEIKTIVDNFFIAKIHKSNHCLMHPFEKIPKYIIQNPTQFDLAKIAGDACLSNSQFERKFLQQVGVSPKFFMRVCRFAQAFQLKQQQKQLDWLSVAIQTGYYDYQHLAKDFKKFAGSMPNSLISAYNHSPEQWLKLI